MIKNYLVIAFRNFLRNKNYTLINVLGLSIGLTSCIVIFLLITYDLSFDTFNTHRDRTYRIVQESKSASGTQWGAATPYPLTRAFRNDFPDIPMATQMHYQDETLVRVGDEKQVVPNILFADSLFFDVFDYKVISGNPRAELGQPGKVFLTESLAKKLLKKEGTTTIKIANKLQLEVAGIIADPPANSHIDFSMVVSMSSLTSVFLGGLPLDQWGMTASGYTYVVLPPAVKPASVNARLTAFVEKYFEKDESTKR